MYQLLIFGFVIILFALVIMLFSHSQSLQRFAVLEFMVLVGVAALWQISVTRNKDFLTSQYLSLFGVYLGDAQSYAGELEQLGAGEDTIDWNREAEDLQNLLDRSLPVTTVDGQQTRYLTAAVYERTGEKQYVVRVLHQPSETSLTEKDCTAYIEKLGDAAAQSKSVTYEISSQKTGVLVYTDVESVAPRYVLLTEVSLAPMQMEVAAMQKQSFLFAVTLLLVATIALALVIFLQGRQMHSLVRVAARVAEGKEDWDSLKDSTGGFWLESNEMRRLKNSLGQISTNVERMN